MPNLEGINVAPCGTHHLRADDTKLYEITFDEVLPFHPSCGSLHLAPVSHEGQSWHIHPDGAPAYAKRFDRTFGFYDGYAAVVEVNSWFHIDPTGSPLYAERYQFAGNFQSNCCVVCDREGDYFHIDTAGKSLYSKRWKYCGDFREGIAVAQQQSGFSTHITVRGEYLHKHWFQDLDVYHKGYARARDDRGWHHIDKNGLNVYIQRYANVEPFYNSCARVEAFDGSLRVIDETGQILRSLREPTANYFADLSSDMVGYWRTFTIATGVELGVFEALPGSTTGLAEKTCSSPMLMDRLLKGLAELKLVKKQNHIWSVLEKGQYLARSHSHTLATAALEYRGDLLQRWYDLPGLIRGKSHSQDIFISVANDPERLSDHHSMLRSYARHDYSDLIDGLPIEPGDIVFDAGGGTGELASLVQSAYPETTVILGDLPQVVARSANSNRLGFDFFLPWPVKADKILLARVLHDWSDEKAELILHNAMKALQSSGNIYILEMLMPDNNYGGALCDLHLLSNTGGQERTEGKYRELASACGLVINEVFSTQGLISILSLSADKERT
ncbi:MAG: hypothetical protein ACJAWL_001081 [Motiliproteus sp.]|jgi:hypothetical protein